MTGFTAQNRVVLALVAAAIMTITLVSSPAPARAEGTGSPIADAALRHLDTYGGQCWTFMQQVVAEATGIRVTGPGYRQGYLNAGAIEVSADEAVAGDIIQIASDANPGWGSYPGLHTAIVLKNLGGGRFDAIDSNQNWDEWVRLRPNYDPYASAARNGLQVHIYRMPGGSAGDTPISFKLADGTPATVAAGGDCLNLRSAPGLSSGRLGCVPAGSTVSITGDSVVADGYTWVPVDTPRGTGWVAADFLQVSQAAAASAPADLAPAATAPAAVAAAPAPAVEAASASAPGHEESVVGKWIHVDYSGGCLRLRSGAGLGGGIVTCLAAGTAVQVTLPDSIYTDGYAWVFVRTEAGLEGWVASEFLVE